MTAEEFFKANVGGAVQVTDRNGVATKGRLMEIRPAATLSGSVTFYLGLDPVGQPRQFFWFDNHTWAVASQPAPAAPAVLTAEEFFKANAGKKVRISLGLGSDWVEGFLDGFKQSVRMMQVRVAGSSWTNSNTGGLEDYYYPGGCTWTVLEEAPAAPAPAPKKKVDNPFPHKCGACGSPAYIGAQFVECSVKWCDGITKIRRAG